MGDLFYKYLKIPLYLLPNLNLDGGENIQLMITFLRCLLIRQKLKDFSMFL